MGNNGRKKTIICFFALLLVAGFAVIAIAVPHAHCRTVRVLLGDVNMDGSVNTGDATVLLNHCVQIATLEDIPLIAADANQDEVVNTGDAVMVLKIAVGIADPTYIDVGTDETPSPSIEPTPDETPIPPSPTPTVQPTPTPETTPGSTNTITLSGNTISTVGTGMTVSGTTVTITEAGEYDISGTLTDGQVRIDVGNESEAIVNLNGVNITCLTSSPFYVVSADKARINLVDGTENYLTDAANYVYADGTDEPNACLYAADDITINGTGKLTIVGNYNHGIACKNDIKLSGGTYDITAVNHGIRGKDSVEIKNDVVLDITCGGDGIQSDNTEEDDKGYITVSGGTTTIDAVGDGIQAEKALTISGGFVSVTSDAKGLKSEISIIVSGGEVILNCVEDGFNCTGDVTISSGTIEIESGLDGIQAETAFTMSGGNLNITSGTQASSADSGKGIKGLVSVTIQNGELTINSYDDCIHSDGTITISGGTFLMSSGDDAIHSDLILSISGGNIEITNSFEGLESEVINLSGGTIKLRSSDDGINSSSSTETSGGGPGGPGGPGGGGPGGGGPGGGGGGGANPACSINISGTVFCYINADGDGIDSNGGVVITGGTTLVDGPTNNGNGAFDYDGTCTISGGILVAAGSAGMAQAPGNSSSQRSVKVTFSQDQSAGTIVRIQSSDGSDVITFKPSKRFRSFVVSTPALTAGTNYSLYTGGTCTGSENCGLYTGGSYSGGSLRQSFTCNNVVTNVNV